MKIVSERKAHLLARAADEFALLCSPFVTEWLSKNEVTADECGNLSETIAAIIRWFIEQPPSVQAEVLFHDVDPGLAKHIGLQLTHDEAMERFEAGLKILEA